MRASTNVYNAGSVKAFAHEYEPRRMDSIRVDEVRAWALRHPAQLLAVRAMFDDARRSGIVAGNPFKELGIGRSCGGRPGGHEPGRAGRAAGSGAARRRA